MYVFAPCIFLSFLLSCFLSHCVFPLVFVALCGGKGTGKSANKKTLNNVKTRDLSVCFTLSK